VAGGFGGLAVIPLADDRRADLVAFLRADLPGAVFPLLNLTPAGLPMRAWLAEAGGAIRAFVGLTVDGMAMPMATPGCNDWATARAALAGAAVQGLIGRPEWVRGLRRGLGLAGAPVRIDSVEQGFDLALTDLVMPPRDGCELEALGPRWRDQAIAWRTAYEVETLGIRPADAEARAPGTVDRWIEQGSHRMLVQDGVAVGMTGFNADLGDVVQVGGVWVPPAGRGRGRARAAVALHLAQARARGASRALLFAVSEPAARAYAAIGFRRSGDMALVLFDGPQQVTP
jgi:RimJ/RimL family protein N-acetyltransferase